MGKDEFDQRSPIYAQGAKATKIFSFSQISDNILEVISPIRVACPAQLILLYSITLIILH